MNFNFKWEGMMLHSYLMEYASVKLEERHGLMLKSLNLQHH